jgi:acyl-CoA thioester hydrolase
VSNTVPSFAGEWRDGVHFLPVRIYYEDTDFTGVVYHASYLRFFERGRSEYLRALGFHNGALYADAASALAFVVCRLTIDYVRPARIDDLTLVETMLTEVRGASFSVKHRILRDDQVLAQGEVKLATVANGKPKTMPGPMRAALSANIRPAAGASP